MSRLDLIRPTVAALAREVLAPGGSVDLDEEAFAECVSDLERVLRNLPRWIGFGIGSLTLVFDTSTVGLTGSRWHALEPERRAAWLDRWRRAPVGTLRDMVDFYDKMATFTYYCAVERREQSHGAA